MAGVVGLAGLGGFESLESLEGLGGLDSFAFKLAVRVSKIAKLHSLFIFVRKKIHDESRFAGKPKKT